MEFPRARCASGWLRSAAAEKRFASRRAGKRRRRLSNYGEGDDDDDDDDDGDDDDDDEDDDDNDDDRDYDDDDDENDSDDDDGDEDNEGRVSRLSVFWFVTGMMRMMMTMMGVIIHFCSVALQLSMAQV